MDNDYDRYRKLENDYFKLKKEIQQEQKENKKLRDEVSKLKQKIKDIKPGKSSGRIKELSERLAEQEKYNTVLHDSIYNLEQEKKQILHGKSTISQSEYDGLSKQLEREKQSKEQYARLYEQEKNKRNELKGDFKTENRNKSGIHQDEKNEILVKRIKELESKLSRKGTGRPRSNKTSDEDVLKLRSEGKSIREICSITGMSTATVVKILRNFN